MTDSFLYLGFIDAKLFSRRCFFDSLFVAFIHTPSGKKTICIISQREPESSRHVQFPVSRAGFVTCNVLWLAVDARKREAGMSDIGGGTESPKGILPLKKWRPFGHCLRARVMYVLSEPLRRHTSYA